MKTNQVNIFSGTLGYPWNKSLFFEINTTFTCRTLGESLLRKFQAHCGKEKEADIFFPSSGLNNFNIDYTASSISAVIKATTSN